MSEDLVRYVANAAPAQLLALTLEDIAICQAWYTANLDDASLAGPYRGLPQQVAQWSADKAGPQRATEGARQQPVLRYCLDALQDRGVGGLHWDELDLLFFFNELIQRTRNPGLFQRPQGQIAPHIAAIRTRRESLKPVAGLPNIVKHITIATEQTVQRAKNREIRAFGGLSDSFRGPVYQSNGTLKVVGDIPDGTAVVVTGGTCYVSGYVLGRLLVGEHAEIQENVAGLLIAQRGNIRARGLINRSTVIAKHGRIACGNAQAPALVYAGTQLRIRENALQGTYFAPRIRVDGEVSGGQWYVSVSLKAAIFTHSELRPLNIVFRSAIGYEDFGETLPKEATTLLRTANRLQARVNYLVQLRDRQAEEAEHYANTALLYMCSGSNAQEALNLVDSLKRRRAFLVRVIMGLHLLTKSLTEQLRSGSLGPGAKHTISTVQRAIARSLGEVTAELSELKLEGNYPVELDEEWEGLMALHAQSTAGAAEDALSRAITQFHESRKAWQEEVMALEQKIEALGKQLAGDSTRKTLLQRAQAEGTSQPVLLQLVKAARQRGQEDAMRKRLDMPFVRRMLGLLKKRNEWVRRYGDEAREIQAELGGIHKKLRDAYGLDPAAQKPCPGAEGIFRAGGRLHVEEVRSENPAELNGTVVVASDSAGQPAHYCVREGSIVQMPSM